MKNISIKYCFIDDDDCPECDDILESLEQIDGEVDQYGIDFVKIASDEANAKFNIINIPSLVYFRKRVPMLYDGDMHHVDKVLSWLTSQDVFEIKNEIEEVNKKMLDKLLDENEFLAVYFCTLKIIISIGNFNLFIYAIIVFQMKSTHQKVAL